MKTILLALMLLIPTAANAASPEESYFAARDAYIDKLKPTEINVDIDERVLKQEQIAREDLEKQLRGIVGPVEIKGFAGPGKSNLETLFKGDQGFGLLDGLLYSSADDKTHVVVSTDALLDHWLKEHRDWWGATVANAPEEIGAALKSEAFYTQALQTDAAVFKYAEVPVVKPAAAKLAFAMLVARAQDLGPRPPDELIVSVLQGGRVLVASTPASATIEPMPACERIWQEAVRKSTAAQEAYAASEPKDEKLAEQATRLEEDGDAAFRRCFAERAKSHASFAALTRQAQALIDQLPSR